MFSLMVIYHVKHITTVNLDSGSRRMNPSCKLLINYNKSAHTYLINYLHYAKQLINHSNTRVCVNRLYTFTESYGRITNFG